MTQELSTAELAQAERDARMQFYKLSLTASKHLEGFMNKATSNFNLPKQEVEKINIALKVLEIAYKTN